MRPPIRGLLALLPLLAIACRSTTTTHSDRNQFSWLGTEPQNSTKTMTVSCSSEPTVVRLHVAANAQTGSIVLRLLDPQGVTRYDETLTSGGLETKMSWPGASGTWSLQLATTDFSGSYALDLSAGEGPIHVDVGIAGDVPR